PASRLQVGRSTPIDTGRWSRLSTAAPSAAARLRGPAPRRARVAPGGAIGLCSRSMSPTAAPITASDDELRAILAEAEIPPLLPALAYLTGDLSLLREELRPNPLTFAMPQGGLDERQQAAARALALEELIRYRDGGCRPAPPPSDADVLRIMELAVGGSGMAPYLPLLEEALAHRDEDRRAPAWHKDAIAPARPFRVLIVGAGMSGLLAAHRLRQAGVDFVVVEKNADVGGTWLENTYPGCRVDNPTHNYSYSFAQRHDWPFF